MTRALILDAATYRGGTFHELVGVCPDQVETEGETQGTDDRDSVADAAGFDGAIAAIQAFAAARHARIRAKQADTEALRCRRALEAAERKRDALIYGLLASYRARDLLQLSPGQFAITETRIRLAASGHEMSHHAVARVLGVDAGTVSVQWKRIQGKLAALDAARVSMPAA